MARWPRSSLPRCCSCRRRIAGVTEVLTERDITQALHHGQRIGVCAAPLFHAAYVVDVDDPVIEHLEVITEFRRFVLAAEDQLKAGNWMMARGGFDPKGRTLKDVLRPLAGQVSIRARLRFHPQNNYVTLPAVRHPARRSDAASLSMPSARRTSHLRPASLVHAIVINGATIEMFYNAPTIDDRVLPVRLLSEGREQTRVERRLLAH